jgi:hypothetical protein
MELRRPLPHHWHHLPHRSLETLAHVGFSLRPCMTPPHCHSLVRAGISSPLLDSAQHHAPLLPAARQEAALVVTDSRGPHFTIGRYHPGTTPPPPRHPVFTKGPRQQGLTQRVLHRVVILHPRTSSTGGHWWATGACTTARPECMVTTRRRAALCGLARGNSVVGLGQRRRPHGGCGVPHAAGRRSTEVVVLGRNRPDGPGKPFSIFSFFK